METVFIYALCEPGTRTVRYIGMSGNPNKRLKNHLCGSVKHKSYLGNWLRSLRSCGKKPDLVILREVSRDDWKVAEERYIRLAKGLKMRLVNATEGGDGGENFNKGVSHPQFGKVGQASHNFGRKHTDEAKANMSAAHIGHVPSEETKAKKRGPNHPFFGKLGPLNHNYGRKQPLEEIAKRAAAIKRKTPEEKEVSRAKRSAALKGVPWSSARRAAQQDSGGTARRGVPWSEARRRAE